MPSSLPVQHRLLSALEQRPGRWAAAIILFSLVARLWFVASGQLNLAQDEAQYWDWSRVFQLSYYSKGPFIAWFIAFWTNLFGPTEFGVRIGAIVNGTLAQALLYVGAARLFRRPRLGVLCLVIANTMPLFLASGILMTTDNILLLCWVGAFFCLYALTKGGRASPWLLVLLAACMALGNLAKYTMLTFFAVAVCHCWLLRRHRLLPRRRAAAILAAMALGSLLGYAPILIWNMQNGWVGFLHVSTLAGVTGASAARLVRVDTALEFLAGQFGVVGPWWMALILLAGWRALRTAWRGKAGRDDPLREKSGDEQIRQASLLAAGFWPLWTAFFLWSFHTRLYANWAGMSYVAGLFLAASGLERLLAGFGSARARRFALAWPGLGAVTLLILLGQQWLPLPPNLDPTLRLKGWSDLGRKLDTLRQEFPNPDKVFFFAHNYDVTAELAFYGPGQPHAYSADFGRRLSQYDFWPGPADPASPGGDKTGWDALYVNAKGGPPPQLAGMFDKMSVMTYTSTHKGKPARVFTIVKLYRFNGRWPHSEYERY